MSDHSGNGKNLRILLSSYLERGDIELLCRDLELTSQIHWNTSNERLWLQVLWEIERRGPQAFQKLLEACVERAPVLEADPLIRALQSGAVPPPAAEEGVLNLHVADVQGASLQDICLSAQGGESIAPPTENTGRTSLRLAPRTQPGDWIPLLVHQSPLPMVFISPWDKRVMAPPFEQRTENFVPIVLGRKSDRAMLENPDVMKSFAEQLISELRPSAGGSRDGGGVTAEQALELVAKTFGVPASEADKALRAWARTATDPYDQGLAAFYEKRYPEASSQMAKSLALRREKAAAANAEVADAARFLGQSLHAEVKYGEAADAFREALELRPEDTGLMLWLADCLQKVARFKEAEPLMRRALAILEQSLGPEHPNTQTVRGNLEQMTHPAAPSRRRTLLERVRALFGRSGPVSR